MISAWIINLVALAAVLTAGAIFPRLPQAAAPILTGSLR